MPRLTLLLTAVLWSLSGPAAKWIALPGPTMAAYRALAAGLVLLLFVRRGALRWRWALVGMVSCFTLMNLCYITALTLTTAANAIFLQCTAPVWSLLACLIWLREKLDRRSLLCVLVGLVGMAWIAGGSFADAPLGIALALASGVFYAGVTVFLRYLRAENPLWLTCLNHLAAGLLLLPLVFLLPGQVVPWELTGSQALALAAFGSVQMALPYLLYAKALQAVSPQEAGVITLVEPVLNPVGTYLVVGEKPAWATVFGGGVVLLAVALRYLPVKWISRSTLAWRLR